MSTKASAPVAAVLKTEATAARKHTVLFKRVELNSLKYLTPKPPTLLTKFIPNYDSSPSRLA